MVWRSGCLGVLSWLQTENPEHQIGPKSETGWLTPFRDPINHLDAHSGGGGGVESDE